LGRCYDDDPIQIDLFFFKQQIAILRAKNLDLCAADIIFSLPSGKNQKQSDRQRGQQSHAFYRRGVVAQVSASQLRFID
jgi:hypothetical protein